jgi:5'-methylthioadenosine nucleosidase
MHSLLIEASVKDMEAAAIAWVAELSSTPFFSLKVVTDIVDGERPTHEEFLENLSSAASVLQKKLPEVIDFVIENFLQK